MKYLLSGIGLAVALVAANADVVFTRPPDGGALLWSSWLDPNGSDADMYAYDDFTPVSNSSITEVDWRGGYFYGGIYGRVFDFSIVFYESIAGGSQPHVNNPQLPEIYLKWYQVGGTAGETPAGGGLYDYKYVLPTPINVTAGVKYWVRIEASQVGYPDWSMSSSTQGDGKYFNFSTGAAMFLFYNGNLAFTLLGSVPKLTGTVSCDLVSDPTGMPVAFTLYNGSTALETQTATLGTGGTYSVQFSNTGGTKVVGKPIHHLSYSQPANIVLGNNTLNWSFALGGDADNNNTVNLLDLSTVLANYGVTGTPPVDGDVNWDGKVNLLDLSTILANFNLTGSQ